MKYCVVVLALIIAFALLTQIITVKGAFLVIGGWWFFLQRVIPKITVDWPSVILGATAVVLFTAGIHRQGRAWFGSLKSGQDLVPQSWKFRWSLAVVVLVLVLFAAGISFVGTIHQVGWLLASDRLFEVVNLSMGI